MWEAFLKVWYFIIVLPYIIFEEATAKFSNFLKKKNLYTHWDKLHSLIVILIILVIILWANGYK